MKPSDFAIWLSGYIPDMPTPFDAADNIDLPAFARLCERQIDAGVTALVVGETAGEFSALTYSEREALVSTAARVARGRVRVIAGAGSNSTRRAIELTRLAEKAGADAILSVVPYYNKPMQAGIEAHFQSIAASTALPIILHDVPSRTVKGLSDDVLVRLASSLQFIGLRDGSGDATRILRLRSVLPLRFRLLCGEDSSALAYFAHEADGCISLVSNVAPVFCREIVRHCEQKRLLSACDAYSRLSPLITALSGESPAALKYALSLLGLALPKVRLPMVELNAVAKRHLATLVCGISEIPLVA